MRKLLFSGLLSKMAMIRRLLLTTTQYKYPLLRAPIIITSRKYSSSTVESFELKHKKFFQNTFGVDVDKKEKASLKNVYEHADLYAKEKTFHPEDVEAYRNR